jgi:hypothetical protein
MRNGILIITDALVEPPTDFLAFRTVTMVSHVNYNMNVLLHTTQEMKDLYYHFMKPKGLMDYIDYILNEREREYGVKLDTKRNALPTIIVKSIRFENQLTILERIMMLSGIK